MGEHPIEDLAGRSSRAIRGPPDPSEVRVEVHPSIVSRGMRPQTTHACNTLFARRKPLAYTVLSTGDMRTPDEDEQLPEISTEQLTEVQGGAGFGDSFMQLLPIMMIMRQRQAPPPVAVAAPPPPPDGWTRVA
jgi:hypothetical protein